MTDSQKTLHLTDERTYETIEGWGVHVDPVYDDETDRVSDIDVQVVRIAESTIEKIHGTWSVRIPESSPAFYVPVENFKILDDLTTDDTHDLRDRLFLTEKEAQNHAAYTIDRFKNPNPWEAFIQI